MKTHIREKGFSILEVLSVVAIIFIIAGLLASSITVTRSKARQSKCINNQYQLAKALIMYATDYDKFPTTLGMLDHRYLTAETQTSPGSAEASFTADYYQNVMTLKRCPEVQPNAEGLYPNSYGLNLYITNQNFSVVTDPSKTVLTADSDYLYLESTDQGAKRHMRGVVASYADGHVEWLRELLPFSIVYSTGGDLGGNEGGSSGTDLGSGGGSGDESGGETGGGSESGSGDEGSGETTPPQTDAPSFDLEDGQVTLNYDSSAHVEILTAQYAMDAQNWYELFVDIMVTLPGGAQMLYNLIDPDGHGITGDMNPNQLEGFSWDSPQFEHGSTIDVYGTAKYWTKERVRVNGKWKYVWVPHVQSRYNTADHLGAQAWVLKDGDAVPTVPGLWNQMSVGESVEQYTEIGADGVRRMNLEENQVIYFFEMGQTSPYLNGRPNPGYDMNDLVVLVNINEASTDYNTTQHGNNGVGNGVDPAPPGNPPCNDCEGTSPGNPGNQGGANP